MFMKKLIKLALIPVIPLVIALILQVIGSSINNEQVFYIGKMILSIGMPVCLFLLVVIGLILYSTGKLADKNSRKIEAHTEADETKQIEDINTSYGYESHRKSDEFMINHAEENYKNSTLKEKFLGWTFLGFLMSDFALIFVFLYLRVYIGIYICFGVFAGTILLSAIIKIILEKTSINFKIKKNKNYDIVNGKVKYCVLSSVASSGLSHRRSTTRVQSVTYKVKIEANGKEYIAYSKNYFEKESPVTIAIISSRRASIIEKIDNPLQSEIENEF